MANWWDTPGQSSDSSKWWNRPATNPAVPTSDRPAAARANNATPTPATGTDSPPPHVAEDTRPADHGFLSNLESTVKGMDTRDWLGEATRLGGGYAAGIASLEPGLGTAIGAGIGSGSEALAEFISGRGYDPASIATAGAAGAIPLGKIFKEGVPLLAQAARGAGLNAGVDVAYKAAHGELPFRDYSLKDEVIPAAFGAVGGAGADLLHGAFAGGEGATEAAEAPGFERAPASTMGPADWPTGQPSADVLQNARNQIRDPELQKIFDAAYGTSAPVPAATEGPKWWEGPSFEQGNEADAAENFRAPLGGEDVGDVNDNIPPPEPEPEPAPPDEQPVTPRQLPDVGSGAPGGLWAKGGAFARRLPDLTSGIHEFQPQGKWWENVAPHEAATDLAADLGTDVDQAANEHPEGLEGTGTEDEVPQEESAAAEEGKPTEPTTEDPIDKLLEFFGMKGAKPEDLQVAGDEEGGPELNASGESAASLESLRRQAGMRAQGKTFAVVDRTGQIRPLIGPDAVDYQARPGESFGIAGPDGFQVLDDNGGKVPAPAQPGAATAVMEPPGLEAGEGDETSPAHDISPLERFFEPVTHQFASPRFDPEAPEGGRFQMPTSPEDVPPTAAGRLRSVMGDEAANDIMGRAVWDARQRGVPFVTAKDLPGFLEGGKPTLTPAQLQKYKFLWNNERKSMNALDELGGPPAPEDEGESGFASRGALVPLATTAAGAAAGPLLERDNPKLGLAGGAGVGLMAGLAMEHPGLLQRSRFSNILSAMAVPHKVAGDLGEMAYTALEQPSRAGALARNLASTQTLRDLAEGYRQPSDRALMARAGGTQAGMDFGEGPVRQGTTEPERSPYNPLDVVPRALSGITDAMQGVYKRSGFTPEEADARTFVNDPYTETGQEAHRLAQKPIPSFLLPVEKVAGNLYERGLSRTPGIATLPSTRAWSGLSPEAARRASAITGLMMLGGGGLGYLTGKGQPLEDYSTEADFAPFLAGGATVPVAATEGAGRALANFNDDPAAALAALGGGFVKALPLPHGFEPSDVTGSRAKATLARVLAQYAPYGGAGKVANETLSEPSSSYDTTDTLFGPLAAQYPILNELLLDLKHQGLKRTGPARPRR